MKLNSKTLDRVLFVPIVILLANFLFRIIDYSKIMTHFPLDTINDISSYIAQLFFLKTCGFHAACSYWYNGFTTFTASQPAWYFFTYPIYALTNNVLVSVFISLVLIFVIAFVIIYFAGKRFGLSITQRIAFFLFMFANAIAIGDRKSVV